MIDATAIRDCFVAVAPHLDERGRRSFAAAEGRSAGYGGIHPAAIPVTPFYTYRQITRRRRSPVGNLLRLLRVTPALLLSGCGALRVGVLNAAGPIAEGQLHLYIIVGIVLVFVAAPVLLLTPIIAWHYRHSNRHHAYRPKWDFSWPLEALIWLPPTGIVIGLGFVLWDYTHQLDPYRPIPSALPALEVQAVGLDWKWLFIYPDQHVAVVNQMAIPVGRPVHIDLTSGTVMQSLLIPQLAGQIYAMAGMRTELNLAADRPGTYRGANVQFNGSGFQNQRFAVLALPPQAYQAWLAQVRQTGHALDAAAYDALFQQSTPPQPVYFSTVPAGLFEKIRTRGQTAMTEKP
jgi:cytochrome o ubiquinol oxidase subunit 2